mgnify:CR=1 FL=1
MPREVISPEQRAQEAAELRLIFAEAKAIDKDLTQEAIALEMQVTQGLMNQWLTGKKTPIPQKRLLWLAARLKFDPTRVRKNLKPQIDKPTNDKQKKTITLYLTDPKFAQIVDSIAEAQGFYQANPQQADKSH